MAIVTYGGGADPVREGFNLLYQFEKVTATTTEFVSIKNRVWLFKSLRDEHTRGNGRHQ